MSFRIIGKFFFLLVIIGFFMPVSCNMNGFQLIDNGALVPVGVFAVYAGFILAILGLLLGVLLTFKKRIPVIIDWLIILSCFACIFGLFFYTGVIEGYIELFQSGMYMALIGSVITLIAQIISAIKKENCKLKTHDERKEQHK